MKTDFNLQGIQISYHSKLTQNMPKNYSDLDLKTACEFYWCHNCDATCFQLSNIWNVHCLSSLWFHGMKYQFLCFSQFNQCKVIFLILRCYLCLNVEQSTIKSQISYNVDTRARKKQHASFILNGIEICLLLMFPF